MGIIADRTPASPIIIGLTGPIGSGCTTLSKFLGDEDYETEKGLSHYLSTEKYIKEGEEHKINSKLLDKRIEQLFEETRHVKDESKLADIHSQAKALLERREFIYSLDHFLTDGSYQKRLRISCSSIIVFDLVRNINSEPNNKIEEIKEFQKTLRGVLARDHDQLNTEFELIFDMVKKYFHHDPIDGERKHEPDIQRLKKCFEDVKAIKKKLTELKLYRELMQDFGDNIRSTGDPYLFLGSVERVDPKDGFQQNNYTIARYIDYIIHYYMNSDERIRFFVIDSFRNPMCIKYLRSRYPKFFLISVFASSKTRLGRISASQKENFYDQDSRDQGSHSKTHDPFFKQNVGKTVLTADIAINNEEDKKSLFEKLMRYIALITDPGCTKPTSDEMFMNMAHTMSMKSNCICRQVGAVIEGKDGYLVGAGWNDVGEGQISCGLRNIKDLKLDEYVKYVERLGGDADSIISKLRETYGDDDSCFCFKDEMSKIQLQDKLLQLKDKVKSSKLRDDIIPEIISELKVKRLEYCKALHAEENAIIQGAKIGGMGLAGSRIYTTTFPCELCAKKIQQSGIKEVIYIEPYPDALSDDLYLKDGVRKVDTKQFEGVKPAAYSKLFQSLFDQKDRQFLKKAGFTRNVI